MGGSAVHLEAGVVDLVPPGVHGGADFPLEPGQAPGHGFQGRAARAGQLRGPGQALGGGHADAQAGKGTRPGGHGDEVQVLRLETALFQQTRRHGKQGLTVGQARVQVGLAQ